MFTYSFLKKYWQSVTLMMATSIAKYNKNTFLGSFWSLLQPFVHLAVISFFFSFLLRQPPNKIVENLVGGLPFWTYISSSLFEISNSLVSRSTILKKIVISKTYFPVADSLIHVYNLVYTFVAMYLVLILLYPEKFSILVIFVPFLTIPLIISITSVGIAAAFLTPYIRDIPSLINVLLGVIYWTIPIIYPYTLIPESKRIFFDFHPLYILIRPMQTLVITGNLPDIMMIFKSYIVCLLSVVVSFFIYKKLTRNVIYYL